MDPMNNFNRRLLTRLSAVLLIVAFPCVARGQPLARGAIKVLKELKAKCQSGIAYSRYSQALADTTLEVNRFLESKEATENPPIAIKIYTIMVLYEEARVTWGLKYARTNSYADRFHRGGLLSFTDEQDKATWSAFLSIYPEADKDIGSGGAVVNGQSASIDSMVRVIWSRAAKELAEAEKLLPGSGIKPKSK